VLVPPPVGPSDTVLYVEDQSVHTLVMQSILRHRPRLHLVSVTTGLGALRRVGTLHPHLLLLDIHLPDCHGAELLTRLRQLPQCAVVPAIAVTSDGAFDGTRHGFCETWFKPLAVHAVLRRLDDLIGRHDESAPARLA